MGNALAVVVDTAISDVATATTKVIEAALEADASFLAFPITKPIFEYLCGQFASQLSRVLQQLATSGVISIQVSSEEGAVTNAKAALAQTISGGDPNAIAAAQAKMDAAFDSLVTWDGTAPPIS